MLSHSSTAEARPNGRRRALRVLTPVAGIAVAALALAACGSGGTAPERTVTKTGSASDTAGGSSTPTAPTSTAPAKTTVKVTTLNSDGAEYGVGMPVIVYFSRKITDAKAWESGTKVTADGKPIEADWYFEPTSIKGQYYEAHLRPAPSVADGFWPAHASIHVQFPAAGTSLGGNFASDGKLSSLDYTTGARRISVINSATHKMTVTTDGKEYGTFPVSLGASNTPTLKGTKVIMEKGRDISMRGPGYYDPSVKFTQRLTYSGEYLHSAPWNTGNIGYRNTSNGCTNLLPSDAEKLYDYFRIGDVFKYPNADGATMRLGDGYGDYNVSWQQWQSGGSVPTQ